MSTSEWVKCPLCGWHWKRFHTGRHSLEHNKLKEAKGEFTFEKGNIEEDAFISIRNTPGGRGNTNSFREVERITLEEAIKNEKYKSIIRSLQQKIENIKKILEK